MLTAAAVHSHPERAPRQTHLGEVAGSRFGRRRPRGARSPAPRRGGPPGLTARASPAARAATPSGSRPIPGRSTFRTRSCRLSPRAHAAGARGPLGHPRNRLVRVMPAPDVWSNPLPRSAPWGRRRCSPSFVRSSMRAPLRREASPHATVRRAILDERRQGFRVDTLKTGSLGVHRPTVESGSGSGRYCR